MVIVTKRTNDFKKKDNEPTKFKTNSEQLKHIANNAHFRNKSLVLHIY